ncbi:tail fiber domain-containing protein [Bdellovibrio sp. HCB185ZH]|uniref:tail fiber domain-containing protein n=1 Tax=Bdellovibrio sp. HCB185ZH TaxID=3394235 RepID=UPI0039A69707
MAVPNSLSYQGRIVKPDGSAFEANNVSFLFEITNPNGTCVIYREQKSGVNMTNSNGIFDVPIGTGSKLFPPSPTITLLSVFDNSQALDCGDAINNVASTYTPALNHSRLLRVQFHDGTGWQLITPDTEIRSVPYAAYASGADTAQTLNGKSVSDFVLKTSIPTCGPNSFLSWNGSILSCTSISSLTLSGDVSGASTGTSVDKIKGIAVDATAPTTGQVLKFDGSKWIPAADATGGGGGSVTSVSGTAGQITVTNGTTTPVLALDNVGTAGTYYKVTTDVHGRITSGVATLSASDIPALDYSKITTGIPNSLSGYGITDAIRNQGGTPGIKSGLNASKGSAGTGGNLYVSTDTKEIYRDNGTTWDLLGSSAGGTITGVTAGSGLTGGGTSGSVTLNVDTGTSANQIVRLDTSAKLPAVDGSALTNLNPSAFSTVVPIAKGGTGQSSATAGFNALSPLTSKGDLLTRDGTNNIRLPAGSDGQVLSSDSSQTTGLKWITPNAGTVTNVTATSPLSVATGGTTPAISISSGSGNAQVLRWDTTNWSASYFNFTDLKSAAGLSQIPNNCTSSQTLVWQSVPDTFACTNISVSGSNFAAQTAGLVFAGPTAGSAAPTFRALASTDLPSGTLSGSGTAGYIPYYSSATVLANSALYTSSSNIGVGTTSPGVKLDVATKIRVTDPATAYLIINGDNTNAQPDSGEVTGVLAFSSDGSNTAGLPSNGMTIEHENGSAVHALAFKQYNAGTPVERMRIHNNGYIGINTAAPTAPLTVFGGALFGDKSTFPSDFNTIETNTYSNSLYNNTATSGTFGSFGSWMRVTPSANSSLASQAVSAGLSFNVPAGVTVSSNSDAVWVNAARNRYAGSADNGTVNSMRGVTITYGHENVVPANTPVTTTAIGLLVNPYTATGTITNMYDIYLGSRGAGATVTNRYGIYQMDAAAKNYFNGYVGIGTNAPTYPLTISGDVWANSSIKLHRTDGTTGLGAGITMSTSNGAMGLPASRTLVGNALGQINFNGTDATGTYTNANSAGIRAYAAENFTATAGGGHLTFVTVPTGSQMEAERMRITSEGYVGIGTATPVGQLHVSSNSATAYTIIKNENLATGGQAWRWLSSATGAPLGADAMCFGLNTCLFTLRTTGNANLTGTLTQASDVRLKKDIHEIPDALKKIEQLRGVTYHWKDPSKDPVLQFGVIAQEVESVYPELVRTDNEGTKSVNYLGFIAPIINALKELNQKFNVSSASFQNQLETHNREIAFLKEENSRLKNNERFQEERLRILEQRLNSLEKSSGK